LPQARYIKPKNSANSAISPAAMRFKKNSSGNATPIAISAAYDYEGEIAEREVAKADLGGARSRRAAPAYAVADEDEDANPSSARASSRTSKSSKASKSSAATELFHTTAFQRRLHEGVFIATLALSFFLLLALFTYNANDPSWSYIGTAALTTNGGGRAGALVADILLCAFGFIAYVLPALLVYTAWIAWRQHFVDTAGRNLFLWRALGFVLILVTSTALFDMAFNEVPLPFGAGGVLGNIMRLSFIGVFGMFGGGLVLVALFLVGITIFCGLSWVQVSQVTGATLIKFADYLGALMFSLKRRWHERRRGYGSGSRGQGDGDELDESIMDRAREAFAPRGGMNSVGASLENFHMQNTAVNANNTAAAAAVIDGERGEESVEEDGAAAGTASVSDRRKSSSIISPRFLSESLLNFVRKKGSSMLHHDAAAEDRVAQSIRKQLMGKTQAALSAQAAAMVGAKGKSNISSNISKHAVRVQQLGGANAADEDDAAANDEQEVEGDFPPLSLLDAVTQSPGDSYTREQLEAMSRMVEVKLRDFGIAAQVVGVYPGPVVTRFELQLAAGTKVSRITTLAKDLARSLSVVSVRVVEVIPGKSVIGLELPNAKREVVRLRDILAAQQYEHTRAALALALGKDISGLPVVVDLARMPHLLVAGTTGSGKSVCLNALLLSLLFKYLPQELRLILIDPKMLELSVYAGVPHLLTPVVTDMKEAANALRWSVGEMERRYKLMMTLGVRNIAGFNHKIKEARSKGKPLLDPLWLPDTHNPATPGGNPNSKFAAGYGAGNGANSNTAGMGASEEIIEPQTPPELEELPYIVVIADEYADMIMVVGKRLEELIARIAQKARAAGIHLLLATQRPSVDVITGLIKANIPARIAFQVSSKIDSRTILDQSGAEQLLGHGDMLYLPPGSGIPTRVHGAFVSDDEVHRVVRDWQRRGKPEYVEEILEGWGSDGFDGANGNGNGNGSDGYGGNSEQQDALYDQAVQFITETRRVSVSSVQRRFKIGYNRAARIVEAMEAAGVVGPMEGNGARAVLAPPPVRRD
jgi:DNA segregation ATPase FtsK/SpoIIIE, S-DNA-T family